MKTIKVYIGIFILIIVLKVVYDVNQPKPIDWKPSFLSHHKKPYGTYIIYNELKNFFPESKIKSIKKSPYLYLVEKKNKKQNSEEEKLNYLFLNDYVSFDKESSNKLLDFVADGNNVFIASQWIPEYLKDTLGVDVAYFYDVKSDVSLKLSNKTLDNTDYYYQKGVENYHFDKLNKENTTVLGYCEVKGDDFVNFVKIRFGDGDFYINTQPYAFTNYHMLESDHAVYVSSCLSYLPDYNIVWDDRLKSQTEEIGSPLRFILSKPAIKWAWYLALLSVLIFMFFRAKRRQRIIPIIKKQENTSIAFAKTIGNLYYQQGQPKDIVSKKITFFLEYIRNTYLLNTQNLNNEFKKRLHLKTGIPKEEIDRLINYIVNLDKSSEIKENSLVTLNKLIDKFYNKTKL